MVKHLLTVLLTLFFIQPIAAQQYGNEWIDYSQKYYKIKIAADGIYRLDSLTLANSGIQVNTIDVRHLQLFNKGKEQALYIEGEQDGVLNATDFIEFYGRKNDGELDSSLYIYTPHLPNPYYSMINDTAVYYLTWNTSLLNLRIKMETDTSFGSYPQADYFFNTVLNQYKDVYYNGQTDVVGGTDSRYVRSETYGGEVFNLGTTRAMAVQTPNAYVSGPAAVFQTTVVGASKDEELLGIGQPDHHINIQCNGITIADSTFMGYEVNVFVKSLPTAALTSGTTFVYYRSLADPSFKSNRLFLTYLRLTYPHTTDLEGKEWFFMNIPDQPGLKTHLNYTNFKATGTVWLYDLTNHKRIVVNTSAGNYHALLPTSGAARNCLLTSEKNIIRISTLSPVTPTAQFMDYKTLSTDSAFIIITNKLLMSSAAKYKTYRSSHPYGGLHHVITVDVDELYDQFAYGICKSPLSIRRFCNYLLHHYPSAPQNLLLLGKSFHLYEYRVNPVLYAKCMVPSFGFPSSDNLFTAGLLPNNPLLPAIATGRIAARSNAEVDVYLNKLMQYENKTTNPPADWMKQILHFGGGQSLQEQQELAGYLKHYESLIEDTLYGGHVTSFFKTSTAPIQLNTSDTLKQLINKGVALMTFFGHAYGSGFDQSIDDVNVYNPLPGHYPFLLANSCYSGDLHASGLITGVTLSSSETFVLAPNKGTIGYLGAVSLGVPYALNMFSSNFYEQVSVKNYGKSVGSSIRNAISNIQQQALTDSLMREVCYDMALHGDPSIKISSEDKPDYQLTTNSIYFDQQADVDSFTVYIELTNVGKAITDSIFTEVTRIFPQGEEEKYLIKHAVPKFRDTISIKLFNDYAKGVGLNKFKATTDAYDRILELNETNNTANSNSGIIINKNNITPVYPYNFAILPTDSVTLKASTADVFSKPKNYIFQLDTIDTFNSPALLSKIINAGGGVVSWAPAVSLIPLKVYYWRVSADSVNAANGYNWREHSFQYIPGKRGWEQAHFFQFKANNYQYVKFNRANRRFDFQNDNKLLICNNGIFPFINQSNVEWKINNTVKTYWSCIGSSAGFNIAVINPVTGENWETTVVQPLCSTCNNGIYGNTQCKSYPYNSFEFLDINVQNRNNITNFLTNVVPTGFYVLAYSINHLSLPYENAVLNSFEQIGASGIKTIKKNVPYIVFGKKGGVAGSAREIIGDSVNSIIHLDTTITTNWVDGFIESPVIGPAQQWDSLSWAQHSSDGLTTYDSISLQLIGIRQDGKEVRLHVFDKTMTDIGTLSNYIDPKLYPCIRLKAYLKDDSLHTPPQLDRWQVIYTPVPELAVNPSAGYASMDSVNAGEEIVIRLPIQNIGDHPFTDSLLVTYWLEDAARVIHPLPAKLKKNLLVGEVLLDTIKINSISLLGNYALWVEVNPLNHPESQLEQYHFNNIARNALYIAGDHTNPLLDVTFDGLHILNNEIVSAKPSILIQLRDENKFLALNDTNDFKIFLQSPGSSLMNRVYFGPTMDFVPAVLPANNCKVNFHPQLDQDGTYQLLVQAKDKSKNTSGAIDYRINFEVVNESSITQVLNYPNPFSTSTRFVFTLTGSEIPSNFKIQIMTITGKVVREITEDELGPLHIGKNITTFAWDGKDQFGDQLANGVYMYRVLTKLNGENIMRHETAADKYFKNGWGKMYLLR